MASQETIRVSTMQSSAYITIPISSISVPEHRARGLDYVWAEALASMFADHGNKTAIEVRQGDGENSYILVAGLHRLEAAKLCEWKELTVQLVSAKTKHEEAEFKLHETMENLGRQDLTILDRAKHLSQLKNAYEKLHPETKNGGDKKSDEAKENQNEMFSFRSEAAAKTGLSKRSVELAVKLWKDLTKPTRDRVVGTWLANHQAGLMTLASVGTKMQDKILDVLFNDELPPKSVTDALEYIEKGKLATSEQRKIAGALKSFKTMPDTVFNMVMSSQRERVVAWAKEQGVL